MNRVLIAHVMYNIKKMKWCFKKGQNPCMITNTTVIILSQHTVLNAVECVTNIGPNM